MQIAIPLIFLSAGLALFLGILASFLAVFGYSRKLLYWLALMSVCAGVYMFTSALYYSAADLNIATQILHWNTVALLCCIPASFGFMGIYTHDRYTLYWVVGAVLNSLLLVFVDLNADVSMRYSGEVLFSPYSLPWGERIAHIQGESAVATVQLHITAAIMLVWGGTRVIAVRAIDRRRFYFLAAYLCIHLAAVVHATLVEFADWHSIKLVGASFIAVVVLMSANITLDLRRLLDQFGLQRDQLHMERSISEVLKHDQERLSQVVAQSPNSIHLLDHEGRLQQRNIASRRLWSDDLENGDAFFGCAPWNRFGIDVICQAVMADGKVQQKLVEVDGIYLKQEPRNRWIQITVFPINSGGGEIEGVAIVSEDVSRQQTIENALKMVAAGTAGGADFFAGIGQQLHLLMGANFVYIAQFAEDSSNEHYSTLAFQIGGELRDNFSGVVSGSHAALGLKRELSIIESGVQQVFPDDRLLAFYNVEGLIVLPLHVDGGQTAGFVCVMDSAPFSAFADVEPILEIVAQRVGAELERLHAEMRIRRMAYEDYITRLPNRAMLHEYLTETLRNCEFNGTRAAAYFLDLDHFKTINEALGHDVGDDVLRRTGERLRASSDESVFVARLGGDEFVVVEKFGPADNIDLGIEQRANDIINVLSQPLELGERLVSLGTSVGVLKIPEHGESELDVMRRGDSALFKAKNEGRNRYEIYDPSMQADVDERLEVERGLRIALDTQQLEIYYQPKVDSDGKVVGAEALIRWLHPTHGFISPASFVPVAEETGLIHLIGDWILDTITSDLVRWQKMGVPEFGDVSINISAWQFARPDFVTKTLAAIGQSGIPVHRFSVEVTETAILRDISVTKAKLAQLRDFGVKVALDDFGTGYSSLAYLKDLPLDGFKIDRAFVDGLHNSQTEALVNSMIAIGRHMDLDVIAEGVETDDQCEKLRQMGCRIFQGYLFGKPMPEPEFLQWLERGN